MSRLCLFGFVAALSFGCAAPAVSAGQDSLLTATSPLEDYLRLAARQHPGLAAGYERWTGATAAIARESAWPYPVLSWSLEPVQALDGPHEHRIGIAQEIPWFSERAARGRAAGQEALAAEQDFRADELRLYERVGAAYYEYAYLGEAIRVTRENLALLTQQESVARARYRTQAATYADLLKAQVEQGLLQDQLRSLEDRQAAVAARLNETLGRDPLARLPWPVPLAAPQWSPPPVEEIRARLTADNPDLQGLDRRIQAAAWAVEAEGRNGLPRFGVGIEAILMRGSSDPGALLEAEDQTAWMASVWTTLPLWRGQVRGAQDAARARGRMLEHELLQTRHELLAAAEDALFSLRDAGRKVELYGDGLLPKARQALEATARGFATGDSSFLDYVDAQRTLLAFQLDHARARADYGQRVLEVARLVGSTPLPAPPPPDPSAQQEEPR